MRTPIVALAAVSILALTAVTAYTAATESSAPGQVRSGGLGGGPQGGFLHGGAYDKLVRGDMSGSGGGGMKGNHKGDMMGHMGRS